MIAASSVISLLPILQGCSRKKMKPPLRSKIVRVTNSEATDRSGDKDNVNLNDSVVREMVNIGIRK